MIQEYFTVRVSETLRMAIPVDVVGEVVQLQQQDITLIPGVDPWFLGVTNQRGNLLWILHLELFLGIKPTGLTNPLTAVVINSGILGGGDRQIGCVVKSIEDVISLDDKRQKALPSKLPNRAKAVLTGVAAYQGNYHVVLDWRSLFHALNPKATAVVHT